VAKAEAYRHAMFHLDPSNRLSTNVADRQTDNGLIAYGEPFYKRSSKNHANTRFFMHAKRQRLNRYFDQNWHIDSVDGRSNKKLTFEAACNWSKGLGGGGVRNFAYPIDFTAGF